MNTHWGVWAHASRTLGAVEAGSYDEVPVWRGGSQTCGEADHRMVELSAWWRRSGLSPQAAVVER